MRTIITLGLATVLQAFWITAASAQTDAPQHTPVTPYSAGQPLPQHIEVFDHASTAFESGATGVARGLDALGRKNYLDSLALLNHQQAAALAMQNRQRRIDTIIARREREQQRLAERREAVRQAKLDREREDYDEAQPLRQAIDSSAGRIVWPAVLKNTEAAERMTAIEQATSRWVAQGHTLGKNDRLVVKRNIRHIELFLERNMAKIGPDERTAVRQLLHNLEVLMGNHIPADQGVFLAQAKTGGK